MLPGGPRDDSESLLALCWSKLTSLSVRAGPINLTFYSITIND